MRFKNRVFHPGYTQPSPPGRWLVRNFPYSFQAGPDGPDGARTGSRPRAAPLRCAGAGSNTDAAARADTTTGPDTGQREAGSLAGWSGALTPAVVGRPGHRISPGVTV
jgi:hypothetical protein